MKYLLDRATNHYYGNTIENLKLQKQDIKYFKLEEQRASEETWWVDSKVYIEVNTLEDLMRLYNHYGSLVIRDSLSEDEPPTILIYDTYIE